MSLLHFLIMNAEKFFHKKKETNPEFYSELVCSLTSFANAEDVFFLV